MVLVHWLEFDLPPDGSAPKRGQRLPKRPSTFSDTQEAKKFQNPVAIHRGAPACFTVEKKYHLYEGRLESLAVTSDLLFQPL